MIQPFRERQVAAICDSCGDAIFAGDLAYVIGEEIMCLQCIGECAVIASHENLLENICSFELMPDDDDACDIGCGKNGYADDAGDVRCENSQIASDATERSTL